MRTVERTAEGVLVALLRAYRDPLRPIIREQGIDERDLAFEADLIDPAEVESVVYGTRKRSAVLRLLRWMQQEGLIVMTMDPQGAYRVLPTQKGEQYAEFSMRPWFSKLWNRLQGRAPPPL